VLLLTISAGNAGLAGSSITVLGIPLAAPQYTSSTGWEPSSRSSQLFLGLLAPPAMRTAAARVEPPKGGASAMKPFTFCCLWKVVYSRLQVAQVYKEQAGAVAPAPLLSH
jgi:hypothetical protein